jgi:uncharacterized protein YceK
MRKVVLLAILSLLLSGCAQAIEAPSPTPMASPTASQSENPKFAAGTEEIDKSSAEYRELLELLSGATNDYRFSILSILLEEGNLSKEDLDALYLDIESGGVEMITEAYYLYLYTR